MTESTGELPEKPKHPEHMAFVVLIGIITAFVGMICDLCKPLGPYAGVAAVLSGFLAAGLFAFNRLVKVHYYFKATFWLMIFATALFVAIVIIESLFVPKQLADRGALAAHVPAAAAAQSSFLPLTPYDKAAFQLQDKLRFGGEASRMSALAEFIARKQHYSLVFSVPQNVPESNLVDAVVSTKMFIDSVSPDGTSFSGTYRGDRSDLAASGTVGSDTIICSGQTVIGGVTSSLTMQVSITREGRLAGYARAPAQGSIPIDLPILAG